MSLNKTVFIATRFGSVKEVTMFGFACGIDHITTPIGNQRSENWFDSKEQAKKHALRWAELGCKRIPIITN